MKAIQRSSKDSRQKPLYLLDYDLSTGKRCRGRFYRKARKLMGQNGIADSTSTASVITTEDEKAARTLHGLASKCGRSNLYVVKRAKV